MISQQSTPREVEKGNKKRLLCEECCPEVLCLVSLKRKLLIFLSVTIRRLSDKDTDPVWHLVDLHKKNEYMHLGGKAQFVTRAVF